MKTIRKIGIGLASLVGLVVLVVVFFFRQEAYQLYKVLTFFNADSISNNFKSVKNIFTTTTVPRSENPHYFPQRTQPIALPESFQFEDSTVNTQAYLDFTLTDALLVIRHDTIYYENYSNQFTGTDHHISWSMSKSVISALIGIAIREGKIKSIEQTVTDYLPEFADTGYDKVKKILFRVTEWRSLL